MSKQPTVRSLKPSQLATIDAMITKAQEDGLRLTDVMLTRTDVLTDIQALFDFSERDLRVVEQIRGLASQLETTVSLGRLIELRADAVRDLSRG
jgi:hypothetical protein